MRAYIIVFVKSISDQAALDEYARIGSPSLEQFHGKKLTVHREFEVLEGESIEYPVILEFPTYEEAKAWYECPVYQEALQLRFKGSTSHAVLVQGE